MIAFRSWYYLAIWIPRLCRLCVIWLVSRSSIVLWSKCKIILGHTRLRAASTWWLSLCNRSFFVLCLHNQLTLRQRINYSTTSLVVVFLEELLVLFYSLLLLLIFLFLLYLLIKYLSGWYACFFKKHFWFQPSICDLKLSFDLFPYKM